MIAKVAVSAANFAIDKPYSYLIPPNMSLIPGSRVSVPFGRGNRYVEGIVLQTEPGEGENLKTVLQSLDTETLISDHMLKLAAFLRERYFCTFYDAIRAMLPAGLWFRKKDIYALTEDLSWQEKKLRREDAYAVLRFLQDCGGQAEGADLRAVFDEETLESVTGYLLKKKWICAQIDYSQKTGDKVESVATLAVSTSEAIEYAARRPKSAAMQKNVLETLCAVGSASVKELCYYTGAKPGTVKRLADLGYVALEEKRVLRCREIVPANVDKELVLNQEQEAAFTGLVSQMDGDKPGSALLYGVTGSGKTAVYIRLLQQCIARGKQGILLVPEIALTPQLLGIMAAYFGKDVAVLHSSLPAGERYDQWDRIRKGEAKVVVGTRSAVFAPCPDLGLIILDEEQEHSYKSENSPRYAASEVALWRGIKEKALVLLGSATPSVETMYFAKTGVHKLYTLKNRYNGKALPQVEIVDMKEELKHGNPLSISDTLRDAIGEVTQEGKQTILFLNRRGNSRAMVCVDCGEAPECPRCSVRLTYHSANKRLMCHYCGHSQPVTDRCTGCGGPLKPIGTGTQKVQEELKYLFPGMEISRMDGDTVSVTNSHEKILDTFQREKIPVLVGTQMVAKGLNLPDVTLVGVLDGDMSLYAESFRGAETTFNMLTQVVGRAGRGDTPGRAIIQTMVPQHKVITLAANQDYDGFYELEIGMRQVQNCPPFADVTTITFSGQDEGNVLRGSMKFQDSLQSCLRLSQYRDLQYTVLGPAPCPIAKINCNYRYRITLRCKMNKNLRSLLGHLLRQFATDRQVRGVSAYIDVNGFE